MQTSDFNYTLPEALIAQTPAEPRDHSRLLVYSRADRSVAHHHFFDVPAFLRPGDVLVVNDTRVIPARLIGSRDGSVARCELLLLRQRAPKVWETLVKPGRRIRPGSTVRFGDGRLVGHIGEVTDAGGRVVTFECEGTLEAALDALGEMPLPPYIHERPDDPNRYQTVYAKTPGSAAAPTAGLHFTQALLEKVQALGVAVAPVLLHVGLGTFRPVKEGAIEAHVMHSEHFEVTPESAEIINSAKAAGGRIVAVGTTSVRVLESTADEHGVIQPGMGDTSIFIFPGYPFRAVDALITNFHLPGSTLLMLVSALVGRDECMRLYEEAVKEQYRFYSFGDAMIIL